jgi:uncharacterized protein YgbK (DUF1537 family)
MTVVLGAIADDFTGATDLASTWARQGLRVVQTIGVPDNATVAEGAEAIVVALKSRTAPTDEAVAESLAAHRWLKSVGAQQIVFKYCSTFDSTPMGNIGPVADALLEEIGETFTVVCPAFPTNRRTVYQGHLFVGTQLLSDSPMRHHPLTPMRDSSLIRLMETQTGHPVGLIPLTVVRSGAASVSKCIADLRAEGVVYAVTDALTDDDLLTIGVAIKDLPLVTGGSGIGMGLPQNFRDQGLLARPATTWVPQVSGRELVLAGSCSAATRAQLADVTHEWPSRKITTDELAGGPEFVDQLVQWARDNSGPLPVVVYASATPEELLESQARYGTLEAGRKVEEILSGLATRLQKGGFSRIVVAGGETSGAVSLALGVRTLRIGAEIAPGVPWCEVVGSERPLAVALKSGNFGGPTFFRDAFGMLP